MTLAMSALYVAFCVAMPATTPAAPAEDHRQITLLPDRQADGGAAAKAALRSQYPTGPLPQAMPAIRRDLLFVASSYRLTVGTGGAAALGVNAAPTTVAANRSVRRLVLPLYAAASVYHRVEGRTWAYGVNLWLTSDTYVQLQRSGQVASVALRVPAGEAFARYYAAPSIAHPYYAELAFGGSGATYLLRAGTQETTSLAKSTPLRVHVAFGRGRIIPIESLLRLTKIEQMLLAEGVIKGPIPQEVGRQILLIWWAYRRELGYAERLTQTLAVLALARLVVGEMNQRAVYAFGRIFEDAALVPRLTGIDSRFVLRYGATFAEAMPRASLALARSTIVMELRQRYVYNEDVNTAWSFEGVLSFAPRREDRADTVLRTALLASPAIDYARLALTTPASWRRYRYDGAFNPVGVWTVRARAGVGWDVASARPAVRGLVNAMAGVGADATWLQSRATGYTASIDVDAGYAFAQFAYAVGLQLRIDVGRMESVYVGPVDGLGDTAWR